MRAHGLVLVDKPAGMTSRQVTSIVSKIYQQKRAGHLGTLDPLATGLLPILIGKATRLGPYLEAADKEYNAQIKLGQATDTMDSEGMLLAEKPVPELGNEQIIAALRKFQGEILQTPPMYSALKHEGQRLYDLARKGETVELKPRKVTIFEIRLNGFDGKVIDAFVRCSPGTYIRALANDLGNQLGCGAHLAGLRRLKVGKFTVDKAMELSKLNRENCMEHLIPMEDVLDFEKVTLSDEDGFKIRDGMAVPLKNAGITDRPYGAIIQVSSKPAFAICIVIEKDGAPWLKPDKVFPAEEIE